MTKISFLNAREAKRASACCAALIALIVSPSLAQQGDPAYRTPIAFSQFNLAPESASGLAEAAGLIDEFRSLGEVREYKQSLGFGLRLTHYIADAHFDVPVLSDSRFQFTANFGFGATTLRTSDGYSAVLAIDDLTGTYVSLRGGISLAFNVAPNCRIFVGAQEYLHFDHQAELLQQSEASVRSLNDAALTFPITFGLSLNVH